jgi:hypothetical protein
LNDILENLLHRLPPGEKNDLNAIAGAGLRKQLEFLPGEGLSSYSARVLWRSGIA